MGHIDRHHGEEAQVDPAQPERPPVRGEDRPHRQGRGARRPPHSPVREGVQEFAKAMERFGIILMDDEMEGLFKKYDADNSGAMDYQEFIKGLMSVEPPETSNG